MKTLRQDWCCLPVIGLPAGGGHEHLGLGLEELKSVPSDCAQGCLRIKRELALVVGEAQAPSGSF